ncbi:MAG TPA: alpha/beta hydrolase [Burkholderiales bacterium]|nr:alpha/beta hydrolase [Burkholderiales bacterium]
MDFLHVRDHRLEYKRIDPGARHGAAAGAPTLVFLHEGLGSLALWKDFPEKVSQATGCTSIVYSRYGYGKSDRLAEARGVDYMHHEALEVLPELLNALSIRKPILIGHSDGASIALIHTGARRRPVRGLVLLAPHVFVEDITVESIAEAKVAFDKTDLPSKLARYHDDAESTFRGWNDIWLHPDFRAWNIEEYLAGVTCPVLLIQGEDDQYGTSSQVEAIARQVCGPVATLMLPNCAHSPHVDQTQATVEKIAHFVRELGDTTLTAKNKR